MIIDGIKLQDLRIFQSVYEHKSMTGAAKELFMTQSGISQHVKILEDELSVVLFDRIQQRLVPTSDAHLLYQKIKTTLNLLEQSLSEVRGDLKNQPTHLMGEVSIGIPPEFGINLVVPKLMPLMKEFPKIKPGSEQVIHFYTQWLHKTLDDYETVYQRDLISAFKYLQDNAGLDILTSAATHGYLPLLSHDSAIRGQLKTGIRHYKKYFGRQPTGIWLPECGYRPLTENERVGIETFLENVGLHYFFTDPARG
jgi:hypothetical protein